MHLINTKMRQNLNILWHLGTSKPYGLSSVLYPHIQRRGWRCFNKRLLSLSAAGSQIRNFLTVSDEVLEAFASGKPIVALESTIITHGMPYPHNLNTAVSVERRVRENGAVPATVAVLKGKLHVGLTDTELTLLAEKNKSLIKVSRRDLPYVLSQALSGGTTVSGTMIAAHMAGISIFATGGIGGVHRGAETSLDISADLTELGRTPVTVISSGIKSILDIPKTLEYLETQGVCVATYAEDKTFPAFFTRDSGHWAPHNVRTHLEAAQMIDLQLKTGLASGSLIAVPIPQEFAATGEVIQNAIEEALDLARRNNVKGKEVTPYILNVVNQLTQGESLVANIALVENNALVAAGIAYCLSQLQKGISADKVVPPSYSTSASLPPSAALRGALAESGTKKNKGESLRKADEVKSRDSNKMSGRPLVFGAIVVDFNVRIGDPNMQLQPATYPGKVSQSIGGVGRNLADGLSQLSCNPIFVSALGTDSHSAVVFNSSRHMDLGSVQRLHESSTATCCVILRSDGQLQFAVGDMDINTQFDVTKVTDLDKLIAQAPLVVLDGNFTTEVIDKVVQKCVHFSVPVWFEPTDVLKSTVPFETEAWQNLFCISPNLGELVNMYRALKSKLGEAVSLDDVSDENGSVEEIIAATLPMCRELTTYIPVILLTLGKKGVLLCHRLGDSSHLLSTSSNKSDDIRYSFFKATYYKALNEDMDASEIVSVSGAGDCLASGFIAGMLHGLNIDNCVKQGLLAASLSLQSITAVPDSVSSIGLAEQEHLFQNQSWQPIIVTKDH